ncbi:TetR/AcrR family transcriptional regulator [Ruania alba]|uniref:DNA-binding transcriptional regulator, AcrR family n=1 Tax=Ruania alba TaxID=648782 RepID=A0A1H5KDA2_9MICO|nr:TetR/AcrR family transcriptional regulator [Ruania alba]SEE62775.1 DNA-binding transcriptional regulator, AcrR family [Ruania alba]
MTDQRSARTGRRPGANDSRAVILHAALDQFAAHGYGSTTIRAVAAQARVDPALVMHFFGSKDQLFGAVLDQIADLPERVAQSLHGTPDGLARRLATVYLSGWESPDLGPSLRAVLRSASSSEAAAARVRDAIESRMLIQVTKDLPAETAARLPFAMAHLFGIATARYILQVTPVAELPLEELIETVTPGLDAVLRP